MGCINCIAQNIISDEYIKQNFNYNVKQLAQFFDRFNYKEKVIQLDSINPPSKITNIASLFNLNDSALVAGKDAHDFIVYAGNDTNSFELNIQDTSNWICIVTCLMSYKGRSEKVDLFLKMAGDSKIGYRWLLSGLQADFLTLENKNDSASLKFISPQNFDVGFSDVSRMLSGQNNIFEYATVDAKIMELGLFNHLVTEGKVVFESISRIKFGFYQVTDWYFEVEKLNRDEMNAGWLITNVQRMQETNKSLKLNEYDIFQNQ